ncbi:putative transcriptional regulator [Heterostelium album PN500]|uniref:Putative transcriptional regulator n=1 Tax=Heterostelium pallidum (strain ATCC 26659 / Pp 5 / PN500) TaxID=670386 RepID=D3B7J3_HETP5|nr:putative transcriptional regulator [Heterostelium album PN500]EFA82736.1 putative transcriptional regulator [Heterostelium album PN500]|eukprot:XP_020434853.1 putative transcriptional regulator [Heterostelium album PN500]
MMNTPIVEIIKQGAVAVEEIRVTPSKNSANKTRFLPTFHTPPPAGGHLMHPLHLAAHQYHQQAMIKQVHVVVKNTPFGITIKSNDPTRVNFHNYVVKSTLLYDCDPPKPVDFIHQEPLQYVATVNEEGDEVVVDIKMSILSSQHQGSLFIVVLHITHSTAPTPSNSEPISTIMAHLNNNALTSTSLHQMCVISHPIRIVSKVDHVKKEGVPILKKKTFHEILTDKLKKLQKSQEGQSKWIKNLYEQHSIQFDYQPYIKKDLDDCNNSNNSTPSFSASHSSHGDIDDNNESDDDSPSTNYRDDDNDELSCLQQQQQQQQHLHHHNQLANQHVSNTTAAVNGEMYFQNSFNRVVEVYKMVPLEDKKDAIKKMVELLRSEDLEQLVKIFIEELHGMGNLTGTGNSPLKGSSGSPQSYSMMGLGANDYLVNNIGHLADGQQHHLHGYPDEAMSECHCPDCPSKKELERFQGLFLTPQQMGLAIFDPSATSLLMPITSPTLTNHNTTNTNTVTTTTSSSAITPTNNVISQQQTTTTTSSTSD